MLKKLLAIQNEIKVPKTNRNDFAGFNYRSCEDILMQVKPLLQKNGCTLTMTDEMILVGDRYYVKATAILYDIESGNSIATSAWAREELSRPKMSDPQCTGTASSYARKYALNGLFCLDDERDPDSMDNSQNQANKAQRMSQQQMIRTGNDIEEFCSRTGTDLNALLHYYGVQTVQEFTPDRYDHLNNNRNFVLGQIKGGRQ